MTLLIAPVAEEDAPDSRFTDIGPSLKRRKWAISEQQERELREHYDSQTATITALARRYGCPRWVVRKWAQDLGLARTKEPRWTTEEKEYLERVWNQVNVGSIARRLNRTATAVALKAKRLQLRKGDDGFTMRQLCVALGEDHHKVERWIESGALKGRRRNTNRTALQGGDMWYFAEKDVRAFIRAHPMDISLRKVDQLWFIETMLGVLVSE